MCCEESLLVREGKKVIDARGSVGYRGLPIICGWCVIIPVASRLTVEQSVLNHPVCWACEHPGCLTPHCRKKCPELNGGRCLTTAGSTLIRSTRSASLARVFAMPDILSVLATNSLKHARGAGKKGRHSPWIGQHLHSGISTPVPKAASYGVGTLVRNSGREKAEPSTHGRLDSTRRPCLFTRASA